MEIGKEVMEMENIQIYTCTHTAHVCHTSLVIILGKAVDSDEERAPMVF